MKIKRTACEYEKPGLFYQELEATSERLRSASEELNGNLIRDLKENIDRLILEEIEKRKKLPTFQHLGLINVDFREVVLGFLGGKKFNDIIEGLWTEMKVRNRWSNRGSAEEKVLTIIWKEIRPDFDRHVKMINKTNLFAKRKARQITIECNLKEAKKKKAQEKRNAVKRQSRGKS